MKRLLRLLLLLAVFFAALLAVLPAAARAYSVEEIPNVQRSDRNRFTSNPDGILSAEAVARIDSICLSLRHRAIAQVAVAAVSEIDGEPFGFAMALFSKWGVGRAENDNGLGILLVEQAREIRFVTGRGVEGVLTDALCKRIQLDYMLPRFRDGDYSAGMVAGIEAVDRVLSGSELDTGGTDDFEEESPAGFVLLLLLILCGIAAAWSSMPHCPHCKSHRVKLLSTRVIDRTAFGATVERIMHCNKCGLNFRRIVRNSDDNRRNGNRGGMWMGGGPFGGGGGSFGGGGGSFGGGFGGGSFGGGGAGSRW